MIAYFLLVHRYPRQFKQLFRAIYAPQNSYVVHVDQNSGPELAAEIRSFLAPYQGVAVIESQPALWGGYSLVDAAVRGMAKLLQMGRSWEFFINLSGQDFPLKSQADIKAFLEKNRGKEFIRAVDQRRVRPETMHRVEERVVEHAHVMERTGVMRPFLKDATPYIGNQWMIVSRAFCQFVVDDPQVERFKAFYRNTFIADEGFFQTVMMNTGQHGQVVCDDLRMIDWVPDGDIKLRPRTYTMADVGALTSSRALFARKFDLEVDSEIVAVLEQRVTASNPAVPLGSALSVQVAA